MEINYQEIADNAVAYAAQSNIELDYSEESIAQVDALLGRITEEIEAYRTLCSGVPLQDILVLHFHCGCSDFKRPVLSCYRKRRYRHRSILEQAGQFTTNK